LKYFSVGLRHGSSFFVEVKKALFTGNPESA